MVGLVGQAVEVVASVKAGRTIVGRGSWPVARLGCAGCCSYADSFFFVAGSSVVLAALPLRKAATAFVVLGIAGLVHS
jgi:hypothetical protein